MRNTPADAGKTFFVVCCLVVLRKHPRGRGEDSVWICSARYHSETPPRTRGRPFTPMFHTLPGRNTPADAGKTSDIPYASRHAEKHPRGRGEDQHAILPNSYRTETPPRTRGRPPALTVCCSLTGNTPADAGKTAAHSREEIEE